MNLYNFYQCHAINDRSALNDSQSEGPPGALPTITLDEFRKYRDGRVWVTLDAGVYDVTPFLDAHPGGAERIMMTHGADLAKFWSVYQLHDRPHIRTLLEEYRVGHLTRKDYLTVKAETNFTNAYANDPQRVQSINGNLRVCVCVYAIYVSIHTHIYTYIHTYIHIQ